MIALTQLSMAYGGKLLFYDVNLLLSDRRRYALVGSNGTGKSTLLKLMTGEEQASEGGISIPKSASIGWLKQDQFRYEDTPLIDVVLQGKPLLWSALQEKEKILAQADIDHKAGLRLGELEEMIAHQGGYTAETFASTLLSGLGVPLDYHRQPLRMLSGGYKLRVLLAQSLFQEPNILLLDEPTNHLDILSIRWLEHYLINEFKGLLIFISHDMEFIDRLADNILDIDYGEINIYSGNYEKFTAEKQLIVDQKLQLKKQTEKKIAEMQRFVDRFGASASRARQAQSRVKMIEKIELPDIKSSSRIAPYFHFHISRSSGKLVLKASGLQKSYENKELFKNLNFQVQRGEKLVIMGENGIGKSTLIKTLLGVVKPDAGNYEWGYETQISYFSQDHHDLLKNHMSVYDWMQNQVSNCSDQLIRKTLGNVLFTKDDVHKDILSLSGGEAARLLLARIMLESGNILVLDEPTNHLDIDAIEALAEALKSYPGTLMVVSHNRHFVNHFATRILFISKTKPIEDFHGSYSEFEQKTQILL